MRTLKFDFEERFGRSPSTNHPIFAWLTEHVSWILTTRVKLTDGRTPYQLLRGSKFNRECLAFGENVFYKLNAGQLKRAKEGKLGSRWAKSIFLGYARDSYEYAVWDVEMQIVELARSIKRVPADQRHDAELIEKVDRRPQDSLHRAAWGSMPRSERVGRMRLRS